MNPIAEYIIFIGSILLLVVTSITIIQITSLLIKFKTFVEVGCEIMNLKLKSLKGGIEAGGLGSSREDLYQINTKYKYTFSGKDYIGHKVNIMDEAILFNLPTIMNYDQELYKIMNNAFENKITLPIWVNKNIPSQSVVTKNIYYGRLMFIFLCFIGSSFAIFYFGKKLI